MERPGWTTHAAALFGKCAFALALALENPRIHAAPSVKSGRPVALRGGGKDSRNLLQRPTIAPFCATGSRSRNNGKDPWNLSAEWSDLTGDAYIGGDVGGIAEKPMITPDVHLVGDVRHLRWGLFRIVVQHGTRPAPPYKNQGIKSLTDALLAREVLTFRGDRRCR